MGKILISKTNLRLHLAGLDGVFNSAEVDRITANILERLFPQFIHDKVNDSLIWE